MTSHTFKPAGPVGLPGKRNHGDEQRGDRADAGEHGGLRGSEPVILLCYVISYNIIIYCMLCYIYSYIVYVCIYIYIYIHTYIHTSIHK